MKVIWELKINGEREMCFRRKKDVYEYVALYKKEHNLEKLKNAELIRWFPFNEPSCVVWDPRKK